MWVNHERSFLKIAETAHLASSTEAAYSEHSISIAGFVNAVRAIVCFELPAREASNFEIDLLRFHRIYLLFDWTKLFFFLCAY